MKMMRVTNALLAAGALLACILPIAGHARALPGFGGKARSASSVGCFWEAAGAVTNSCGAASDNAWWIPLVVDPAGNYTPQYSVKAPSPSNTIGCQTFGVDQDGATWWVTPVVYPSVFGSPQRITPGTSYVPPGGSLYGACFIGTNASLKRVAW